MSVVGGLELVPHGDGRWLLQEADVAGSGARLGTVVHDGDRGFRVEAASSPGMPTGPYGTAEDALEAVATWRLARFSGDR